MNINGSRNGNRMYLQNKIIKLDSSLFSQVLEDPKKKMALQV